MTERKLKDTLQEKTGIQAITSLHPPPVPYNLAEPFSSCLQAQSAAVSKEIDQLKKAYNIEFKEVSFACLCFE